MREGEIAGRGVPPDPRVQALLASRSRDPELIAIIGAGPSGLLAAHAAALAGREPIVFSAPDLHEHSLEDSMVPFPLKSKIGPATYLHDAIPDLTSATPDDVVKFVKLGTKAGYAAKVYGDRLAPCSWDKFEEGCYPAWSLEAAYETLWKLYHHRIIPVKIEQSDVQQLIDDYAMVISTIPAPYLCQGDHSFHSRNIWVKDEHQPVCRPEDDPVIVYNGEVGSAHNYYRTSLIFGKGSTEYSAPVKDAREGIKVVGTDCDCWPELVRAGRWGEWKPGVLTHHVFEKVWNLMFDNFEGA